MSTVFLVPVKSLLYQVYLAFPFVTVKTHRGFKLRGWELHQLSLTEQRLPGPLVEKPYKP